MSAFTSSTVHCARCHDHKFDPIPQRDYYALQAVFAGVDRANREYDADPAVHRRRHQLHAEKEQLERNDPAFLATLASTSVQAEIAAWEREHAARRARWSQLTPLDAASSGGATLELQSDGSIRSSGACPERDTYTIRARCDLQRITEGPKGPIYLLCQRGFGAGGGFLGAARNFFRRRQRHQNFRGDVARLR
jgi:hypothetical protein